MKYRQTGRCRKFKRSRQGLEPSTNIQEGVGRFQRSRQGLEPSTDNQEGLGHI